MAASEGKGGRPMVGAIRSPDDHADLLTFHVTEIRRRQAQVEKAKGPLEEAKAALKEQRDELSTCFDLAQADLGRAYTRKYLEGLIADGNGKTRTLVEIETMRARDKVILGQPVYGQQAELFPGEGTPTLTRDEMAWEAEGYARGLRGDLEELQSSDPPEFHQVIMRGYADGQKKTAERVQRGMELRAKIGQPDAEQEAVDLNSEPEDEEEVIDEKVRRLKRSDFMKTGGEPAAVA